MAKALGVGGVFFKAANPEKLAKWYSRHLRFKLDMPTYASFSPKTMPKGGTTVWSPFPARTKYFAPSKRPYMLNLIVDDLDGALRQVKRGGAKIVGKVQSAPYGRFGGFLDPERNKVELWELPKPKARKRKGSK
jgi:predicted enzyme related to lactoylglutathione lyase